MEWYICQTCEISVVGRVNEVSGKRLSHILVNSVSFWVQYVVLGREEVIQKVFD